MCKRKIDDSETDDDDASAADTTVPDTVFIKSVRNIDWFCGTKGQLHAAIKHGTQRGDQFFVGAQFKYKEDPPKYTYQFTSFKDKTAFWDYYEALPDDEARHYYEILTGTVRLVFDMDMYDQSKPSHRLMRARKDCFLNVLRRTLQLLNVSVVPRLNVITSSRVIDGRFKTSYHIVVTNIGCDNLQKTHRAFVDVMQYAALHEPYFWRDNGGTKAPNVDHMIYSTNRMMRMALSSKATDASGTVFVPDVFWSYGSDDDDTNIDCADSDDDDQHEDQEIDILDYYDVRDSYIQVGNATSDLDVVLTFDDIEYAWKQLPIQSFEPLPTMRSALVVAQKPKKTRRNEQAVSTNSNSSSDDRVVHQLQTLLIDHGDSTSVVGHALPGKDRVYPIYNNAATRVCATGNMHESNNAFFYVVNNTVYYRCHSASCSSDSVWYGHLPRLPASNDVESAATNDDDDESVFPAAVASYNKYCEERVSSFGTGHTKAELIKSGVRTYKTTTLVEFIRELTHTGNTNRVIVISNRITLADFILYHLAEFGFKHYQSDGVSSLTNKVITQYESLYRFAGVPNALRYDIVIIDEITALLPNITTTHLGGSSRCARNAMCFQKVIEASTKFIGMDADLDRTTVRAIGDIVGGLEHVSINHNTFLGWKRDILLYNSDTHWFNTLVSDIKNDVAVHVVCGLKDKVALKLREICVRLGRSCVCITSDTPADDIRNFFDDINNGVNVPQVFVHTAKIQNGVSITVMDHYTRTYLFGHYRTSTARELMQMVGRVRSVKDSTIRAYIHQPPADSSIFTNSPVTTIAVMADLAARQEYQEQIMVVYVDALRNVQFDEMPSWWKMILVRNIIEVNKSRIGLLSEVVRLIDAAGGKSMYAPDSNAKLDKDAAVEKADKVEDMIRKFDDAPDITYEEYDKLRQRKRVGQLTTSESWALNKFTYRRFFTGPVDGIHYATLDGFKGIDTLKRFTSVSRLTAYQVAQTDASAMYMEDLPKDLHRPNVVWYDTLIKLSSILGLQSPLDTRTIIPANILTARRDDIQAAFETTKGRAIGDDATSIRCAISTAFTKIGLKLSRPNKNTNNSLKLMYIRIGKRIKALKDTPTCDPDQVYVNGGNIADELQALLQLPSCHTNNTDENIIISYGALESRKAALIDLLRLPPSSPYTAANLIAIINAVLEQRGIQLKKFGNPERPRGEDGTRRTRQWNYKVVHGNVGERRPMSIPEFAETFARGPDPANVIELADVIKWKQDVKT